MSTTQDEHFGETPNIGGPMQPGTDPNAAGGGGQAPDPDPVSEDHAESHQRLRRGRE